MNDALFTCDLCGNTFQNETMGAIVLPWGITCGDCLKLISNARNAEMGMKENN